jgi:hypothetical protein
MGIGEPQEAEKPNNDYLADDWEAVDQKGANPASDGRFDQIQHVHNTALNYSLFSGAALATGLLETRWGPAGFGCEARTKLATPFVTPILV